MLKGKYIYFSEQMLICDKSMRKYAILRFVIVFGYEVYVI
ncbi:hypothetical protein F383_27540 [Gossypium arboreum]|uniref:Uncharacterized protein n=1 Tax=Gossypium arboreum TaxID=29729 RepID=A0A0B0PBZ5_GOSAR|nr:hypothetical protein F383_27540 [Gossypium arboreum]